MNLQELISEPGVLPDDPGADRVLVVDDDVNQRMMLVRILRRKGYECGTAMSTQEARDQLRRSPYGLVVTDMRMFAENGIELVRHIADRYPDTYSIVVSGFVSEDEGDRILRAGAYDFMCKPVEHDLFGDTIETAFEQRKVTVAERRHRRS